MVSTRPVGVLLHTLQSSTVHAKHTAECYQANTIGKRCVEQLVCMFTQRTDANVEHTGATNIYREDGQVRSIFALSVYCMRFARLAVQRAAHRNRRASLNVSSWSMRPCEFCQHIPVHRKCQHPEHRGLHIGQYTPEYMPTVRHSVNSVRNSPTVSLARFLLVFLYDARKRLPNFPFRKC